MNKPKHLPLLFIILLNLVFFSRGLLPGKILSSTDILQTIPTFSVNGYLPPQNTILFDQTTQYFPWLSFLKEQISSGKIPLINPYNSTQTPFLANPQTTIFFPLTYLYLIFDFKYAVYLYLVIKFSLVGIFSYLFFKEINISDNLSLLGSVGFNFCGFNLVWGLYPLSNSLIFLPLILLILERYINRNIKLSTLYLWLVLAYILLMLSGHPETAFHITLITGLYLIFSRKYKCLLYSFIAIIISLLITLFQWIPFIRYLLDSNIFAGRSNTSIYYGLPWWSAILNIYPNLFGNPTTSFYRPLAAVSNYNEYAGGYVFPLFYFLALVYLVNFIKSNGLKLSYPYILLCLIFISIIYHFPFLNWSAIPILGTIAHQRLLFSLGFFSIILSLKTLNKYFIKTKLYLIAYLFISVFLAFCFFLINHPPKILNILSDNYRLFFEYQLGQIFIFISILSLGLYIISGNFWSRLKAYKFILLSLLVFLNSFIVFGKYFPLTDRKYFFPETRVIKKIQDLKPKKIADIGDLLIPANVNLWYRFNFIDNYDAIEFKSEHDKIEKLLPNRRTSDYSLDINNLHQLGVDYLISLLPLDKNIIFYQKEDNIYEPLIFGHPVRVSFTGGGKLTGLIIKPVNYNRINSCNFQVTIKDEKDNLLFEKSYPCKDVYNKYHQYLKFDQALNIDGKNVVITISSDENNMNNSIGLMKNLKKIPWYAAVYEKETSYNEYELIFDHPVKIYRVRNDQSI